MKMIKTSLLMTALMAASGFAIAQTSPAGSSTPASPTAPATRAEVKSEIVRPDASVPPKNLSEPPKPGRTSETTRAEVKSDVVRPNASVPPKNLSEPPKAGTKSDTTRAEVKSDVDRNDRQLSTGEKAAVTTPSKGSVQRKMTRDERRAMNKSKKDMQMKSSSSAMPQAEPAANK